MNIYFTGAHGTGKTTTAEMLTEKINFGTLPSVSRSSPHEKGTPEHQRYVMDKVVHRTKQHDNSIQDRTPIDVFAYTILMDCESEYDAQRMQVERFLRVIKYHEEPIFYFPICFPLVQDGVRPGKWEQIVVDSTIRGFLKISGVDYHVMPDGSPEDRLEFILERLPHA